jgi:phospho-N-acetylmuramoyl-pentapeptide-transferase
MAATDVSQDQPGEFIQESTAVNIKSTKTTIPFVKDNEFDYSWLVPFAKGKTKQLLGWLVFMAMVIFVVVSVSNGVNLTDGLDGLATGTTAISGLTLGILAYVSGNIIYADYLNIMYIPNIGELVIFAAAFAGATVGFLWYNSYPAQVFMGDTGSLALGGIIAVFAIVIRKELLIPILCGVFFVESLSVMLQVSWFKRTKRKFGVGRRIFLMAPLHHHYQKKGYAEPKIVTRFWIIALILAVLSVVTLKIR